MEAQNLQLKKKEEKVMLTKVNHWNLKKKKLSDETKITERVPLTFEFFVLPLLIGKTKG